MATLGCAIAFAGVWGCGAEAATPDKLYGIWSGKSKESSHVTYTFILGGKCEVDFPKDKKPLEKAKWSIENGEVTVLRASGKAEKLRLSGFDLTGSESGLSIHKLGMEY
ncbi:MAG: hypothetical protein H7Y17_13485 [Chlorobia bacterium]|nr:hypothetical protein [Fimbriimonadaceae bacterium]